MKSKINKIKLVNSPNQELSDLTKALITDLYVRRYNDFFALSYRYVEREDLAGEALSDVFNQLLSFGDDRLLKLRNLDSYSARMVINRALGLKEEQNIYSLVGEKVDTVEMINDTFVEELFKSESFSGYLNQLLMDLESKNKRYAQVLRMKYWEKYDHSKIAELLSISVINSRVLLTRAIKALKKLIDSIPPDNDPTGGVREFISSLKNKKQKPKKTKNGPISDNDIENIQNLRKIQMEKLFENSPLYNEVKEGYEMMLRDFGNQQAVQEILDTKKKELQVKLFGDSHHVSDLYTVGLDISNQSITDSRSNNIIGYTALHALIHSLSKSEKRYVKVIMYCDDARNKNYISLFDAIDKQEKFNEIEFQKELENGSFAIYTSLLYEFILDVLEKQYSKDSRNKKRYLNDDEKNESVSISTLRGSKEAYIMLHERLFYRFQEESRNNNHYDLIFPHLKNQETEPIQLFYQGLKRTDYEIISFAINGSIESNSSLLIIGMGAFDRSTLQGITEVTIRKEESKNKLNPNYDVDLGVCFVVKDSLDGLSLLESNSKGLREVTQSSKVNDDSRLNLTQQLNKLIRLKVIEAVKLGLTNSSIVQADKKQILCKSLKEKLEIRNYLILCNEYLDFKQSLIQTEDGKMLTLIENAEAINVKINFDDILIKVKNELRDMINDMIVELKYLNNDKPKVFKSKNQINLINNNSNSLLLNKSNDIVYEYFIPSGIGPAIHDQEANLLLIGMNYGAVESLTLNQLNVVLSGVDLRFNIDGEELERKVGKINFSRNEKYNIESNLIELELPMLSQPYT